MEYVLIAIGIVIIVGGAIWLAARAQKRELDKFSADMRGQLKAAADEAIKEIRSFRPADMDQGVKQPRYLLITLRYEIANAADGSTAHDILALATAAAPSTAFVMGNIHYCISVSVDPSEEAALRLALDELCYVEENVPLTQYEKTN